MRGSAVWARGIENGTIHITSRYIENMKSESFRWTHFNIGILFNLDAFPNLEHPIASLLYLFFSIMYLCNLIKKKKEL